MKCALSGDSAVFAVIAESWAVSFIMLDGKAERQFLL
jgi:hypothetical protein